MNKRRPQTTFNTSDAVIKIKTERDVKLKFITYAITKVQSEKISIKANPAFLFLEVEKASMVLLIDLKKEKVRIKTNKINLRGKKARTIPNIKYKTILNENNFENIFRVSDSEVNNLTL